MFIRPQLFVFALTGIWACTGGDAKQPHDEDTLGQDDDGDGDGDDDGDDDGDGVLSGEDCDDQDADVGALRIVDGNLELTYAGAVTDFCPSAPGCKVAVDGDLWIAESSRPDEDDDEGSECGRAVPDTRGRCVEPVDVGDEISSLAELSCLVEVSGTLYIRAVNDLESLEGLESLTAIRGSLDLYDNDRLKDLSGLTGLSAISNSLVVRYNASLSSLDGLSALTDLKTVTISGNPSLTSLEALARVQINGSLTLSENDALGSLAGLEGITHVSSLTVTDNAQLQDLTGLSGLETVRNDLTISGNPALLSLTGLSALADVQGELEISDNASLSSLSGLDALSTVYGGLSIEENDALGSLSGLEGLRSIGGDALVRYNPSLSSVSALTGLTSLGGDLYVCENDALPSAESDALIAAAEAAGGVAASSCARNGEPGTFWGELTHSYALGLDPDGPECLDVWSVTGQPAATVCEDCYWAFDLEYTADDASSVAADCGVTDGGTFAVTVAFSGNYWSYSYALLKGGGSYGAYGYLLYPYYTDAEVTYWYALGAAQWSSDDDGELSVDLWGNMTDDPTYRDGETWYETDRWTIEAYAVAPMD